MVNDQVPHANIGNTAIDPKAVLVENAANAMNGPSSQSSTEPPIYAQVSNSPPMAVLPLNPSAKLDQEPNPFEQSFSTASTSPTLGKVKQSTTKLTGTIDNNNNENENNNNNNNNNNKNDDDNNVNGSNNKNSNSNSNNNTKEKPHQHHHHHHRHSVSTTTSTTSTSSSSSLPQTSNTAFTAVPNHTLAEPLKLPPVAAMTSPSASTVMSSVPKDIASQYAWDSLRAGPLSPSMLQRPTNPDDYAYSNINPSVSMLSYADVPVPPPQPQPQQPSQTTTSSPYQLKTEAYYPQDRTARSKYQIRQETAQQKVTKKSTGTKKANHYTAGTSTQETALSGSVSAGQRRKSGEDDDDDLHDDDPTKEKAIKRFRTEEEDEKRKNFLERNRLAALKCRQRKKQWLNNLQAKVEYLTNDNEQLQLQTSALREEIMTLKTLLLAHKDCPISQSNGFPANLNPKAMGVAQPQQPQQKQPQPQQPLPQALPQPTTSVSSSSPSSASASQSIQAPPPSILHGNGGGANNPASVAAVQAASAPVSMTPVYIPQSYNSTSHHPQPQPQHQHRLSSSSASSQSSAAINMVMVSQHQVTAPQSSIVTSSSGVLQF